MTIKLKNNIGTESVLLDRIPQFDERSKQFPLTAALPTVNPRSYTWRCNEWFDQGQEGACVAYALGHELASRPAETRGMNDTWLKKSVYWEAQKIDPWEGGSYPGADPFYEGTSVLAGVKILKDKGVFKEYRWAFGIDEVILGLGRNGPAVLGLPWYEGMFEPDSKGYIQKTGRVMGGHAIMARGVNLKTETITLRNSWGKNWGKDGDCYIKFHELESLLKEWGEAVFLVGRTKTPMVPYTF